MRLGSEPRQHGRIHFRGFGCQALRILRLRLVVVELYKELYNTKEIIKKMQRKIAQYRLRYRKVCPVVQDVDDAHQSVENGTNIGRIPAAHQQFLELVLSSQLEQTDSKLVQQLQLQIEKLQPALEGSCD